MTAANPYGTDIALINVNGVLDADPTMREVSGLPVFAQSLVARQTTPTGSMRQVPDDCFDVRGWLSKGMTTAQIAAIGPRVANELQKDERVRQAIVTATFTLQSATLVLVEQIVPVTGTPFKLTLTLTPSNVSFIIEQQPSQ